MATIKPHSEFGGGSRFPSVNSRCSHQNTDVKRPSFEPQNFIAVFRYMDSKMITSCSTFGNLRVDEISLTVVSTTASVCRSVVLQNRLVLKYVAVWILRRY